MIHTHLLSSELLFVSPIAVRPSQPRDPPLSPSASSFCPYRAPSRHVAARSRVMRMGLFDTFKNILGNTGAPAGMDLESTAAMNAVCIEQLKPYFERVDAINAMEPEIEAMTDAALRKAFQSVRADVAAGTLLDTVADRVFAMVREATFRVLSLRLYDVQLVGGMILNTAAIAEMATGEGKTIVAALPAVLNALSGESVFIVTVNDYLARRDAELVGQVFRFCGLSVGLIQAGLSPAERRAAYTCDITYVTNSELGFDYLRDNLAMSENDIVLTRPLGFCIIDEADSILIDEARTPLIISGRVPADATRYATAKKAADVLMRDVHYTVDEKQQSVLLTERGFSDLEGTLRVTNLFEPDNPWASFITNSLKAKELFKKDINYIIDRESDPGKVEIQIVDEFTGRVLKGRRWSDGLHQAVEAKEDIPVDSETLVSAKISYQSLFRLFNKLSGMTGTAATEASELIDVYDLPVVTVPTALPLGRKDYPDVVFKNANGKYRGVMREIARVAPTGRPILIGTTSVEASETLSQLLTDVGVDHDVLNAKPESALRESEIVAQAGRKYSITIATNMAGRGTDILLGGNSDFFATALARRQLASLNEELFHSLTVVDNPILIDDDALPVDLSEEALEDLSRAANLVRRSVGSERLSTLTKIDELVAVAAGYGPLPQDIDGLEDLREAMGAIKDELYETVQAEREEVLDLGGLYVLGTERAESRRVDNQLRGRSGRQGDPGGSRFFLALDDRLFRVFGGDKVQGILDSFRVDDDTPMENALVNNTLNSAQRNVEEYFRDIRASVFKYDELLTLQRSAFYKKRRDVVCSRAETLESRFRDDCLETANEILASSGRTGGSADDFEKLSKKLLQFYDGVTQVSPSDLSGTSDLSTYVTSRIEKVLSERRADLDGVKSGFGFEVLRFLWLTQMDNLWQQHMKKLDFLKEFSSLRTYGNEDALQSYQSDGYNLFIEMLANVRRNNVYSFFQNKAETLVSGAKQ